MRDEDRDRFVGALLGAALARPQGVEPRPGLEARVLARLRERERAKRWLWRKWAPVAAAAVMLVSLAAAITLHPASQPADSTPAATAREAGPRRVADSPEVAGVAKPDAAPREPRPSPRGPSVATVKALPPSAKRVVRRSAAESSPSEPTVASAVKSGGGWRVDEVRIADLQLDEIAINQD